MDSPLSLHSVRVLVLGLQCTTRLALQNLYALHVPACEALSVESLDTIVVTARTYFTSRAHTSHVKWCEQRVSVHHEHNFVPSLYCKPRAQYSHRKQPGKVRIRECTLMNP